MKTFLFFREIRNFLFFACLQTLTSAIYLEPHENLTDIIDDRYYVPKILVPKASFTQKGYIQFLKYVVDVPEITEYTFCIWVRSNNLKYNHPLLSYSKDEHRRLIRVWISPQGTHLNFELLGLPVFKILVNLIETKWYHICKSWSSHLAAWSLFLNGNVIAIGYQPKLQGAIIPSGGDIVVGQEYTDFDKGLDDGIEGDVSGFNFVLASTFNDKFSTATNNIFKRDINNKRASTQQIGQLRKTLNRRQIWDETMDFFSKQRPILPLENAFQPQNMANNILSLDDFIHKPLGLLLVELTNDCGYLRGAPLTGKGVLVSWTRTEVRVFGGAILKTVRPFCGTFKRTF